MVDERAEISCETQGHFYGPAGKCVFCEHPKPVEAKASNLVTRLRMALYRYGCHYTSCPKRPCTCGFLDEWKAAELPETFGEARRIAELKELSPLQVETTTELAKVDELLQTMIVSSQVYVEADGTITGYKIKTGALHKLVGLRPNLFFPQNLPLAVSREIQKAYDDFVAANPNGCICRSEHGDGTEPTCPYKPEQVKTSCELGIESHRGCDCKKPAPPTCAKHGVELAFEGDGCRECSREER